MVGTAKYLFIFLLIFFLFSLPTSAEIKESRAILDERFNWLTKEAADTTLQHIKEAGFNVFIPCVWHGRGTSWPSKLAPKEPLWAKHYHPDHDPLRYLIKKAHEMNIEVHPWFTVSLRQRNFFPEYYDDGMPKDAFNVHLPEFRKFIIELMLEVARNYNVDGINLDYIRTKGVCTSNICVNNYKVETGRELLADSKNMKILDVAWENILKWNSQAIDDIVKNFASEVRRIRPNIIISVDSHAGRRELSLQGADSIKWVNNGWIDIIYHMDYSKNIHYEELNNALKQLKNPNKLVLLVGNYEKSLLNKKNIYPRDPNSLTKLIIYSQTLGQYGNGVALYQYRFLTNEQIKQLRNGPFKEIALPSWKIQRTGN